jgi:hypothetical protein
MTFHSRHKPVLPDYVRYMANDAKFLSKDIVEIFGFSYGSGCIDYLIGKGYLPEPSREKRGAMKRLSRQWTKLEIIEAINKYNKEFFGE